MVEAKKFLAKLVLLGDMNVGKTSLINKFSGGDANPQATVGTDFKTKSITIDGQQVTLQMWDTAGQEKHASIGFAFYRGANCCILTYDLSNQESFDRLDFWKRNFLDKASPQNAEQFPFVVVGNKTDQNRVVSRDTAEAWCQNNGGYGYFETCATSGEGVQDLFMFTGRKAVSQANSNDDDFMPSSLAGAQGAIKIDRQTEKEAEQNKEKKKKKCKC